MEVLCWLALTLILMSTSILGQNNTTTNTTHQVCMLVPASTDECFRNFEGKPIKDISAKLSCLQDLLWTSVPDMSLDEKDQAFLRNLSASLVGEAGKRAVPIKLQDGNNTTIRPKDYMYPASGYRVRKEYRLLTPEERRRFHSALKRLYTDGFINTFAKIFAMAGNAHHGGASFLPWNRIFLIMFEEALRLYDQKVSLPYWASRFDNAMPNPVNSIMWSSELAGDGEGMVTSGPAAYWVTANGGLERDFGKASTLFKSPDIQQILSQCRLQNISRPSAKGSRFDLEGYQGGPHAWVGGDMSAYATAGYDPVFYMHRAYVDYIWDQFRKRQRIVCGVDPATDYPSVTAGDSHHPEASMTGFDWFKNNDGIKPQWTDSWYTYDTEPSCPNCCPLCPEPALLYCDLDRNICVSRSRLIDDSGLIDQNVVLSLSDRSPAKDSVRQRRPRNRGRIFDAPPSDGRTVYTALKDAMVAP